MVNCLLAGAGTNIGGLILAVVILLAMVTIHEWGHYIAGKLLNFQINEFSVGFGPAIFKKRSKKTGELFALRIIPLGGYCAFEGEDTYDEPEEKSNEEPFTDLQAPLERTQNEEELIHPQVEEFTPELEKDGDRYVSKESSMEEYPTPKGEKFNDQAPWKRIIVLLAGATMNYLLALVLIIIMFTGIGRPLYSVVKEKPSSQPTAIATQSAQDGLQTGDIILSVNGKNVYLITDYIDALNGKKAGTIVDVRVLTSGEEKVRKVTLQKDMNFSNMSNTTLLLTGLDIYGLTTSPTKQGFLESIGHSFVYSFKIGGTILRSLGELLTGKIGLQAMGGPITTIKVTSQIASSGLMSFLNIASFIGVNLAVFNLLPIPALDGCKVIFCLVEWIRKKPVNRKIETIIHLVGILFLFGFSILIDILQFFW